MIEVFDDAESLAVAAANYVASAVIGDVNARGRCTIALSGGSTPQRTYELLARKPLCGTVSWPHVHVFWGDERCVGVDDGRSNERMARRALLDHVPIDERNVHPIRCPQSSRLARDPRQPDTSSAALSYDALLRRELAESNGQLDLVLLGIGDDGHTAALFPHSPALDETTRWTAQVQKPGEDIDRITMTLPLLNRARRVVFIVSGASKASTLRVIINDGGGVDRLPAALVSASNVVWLIDKDAASML